MKTELPLPCNKKFVPPGTQDKMEVILIMPCCAGLLVCFFVGHCCSEGSTLRLMKSSYFQLLSRKKQLCVALMFLS